MSNADRRPAAEGRPSSSSKPSARRSWCTSAIDAKTVDSGDPDAPEELPGEGSANLSPGSARGRRVRVGDQVDVVVASEHMHFFDAQTHEAIWS